MWRIVAVAYFLQQGYCLNANEALDLFYLLVKIAYLQTFVLA